MSALDGVRVVEMGMWVAGPAAGGMLADWGADVVKIEPKSGDPMRKFFVALSGSKEERCPPFDLYNRGKRSVAIDVGQPDGLRLIERLIETADVFITNMRPTFLLRVGLDAETLMRKHPGLVYASLTAYGLVGPDRDAPGYDMSAFQGRSGVTDRSTQAGAVPTTLPGGIGDNVTAITLTAGIAAALFHRERTGEGQLVSTSLLRAAIFSIGMDVSTRLALGRISNPSSRSKPRNPLFNLYKTGDEKWFWLVCTESERHWPKVIRALGVPEWGEDSRYLTPRDRRRNSAALVAAMDDAFARRTKAEWADIFRDHDVWWAPINSVNDLMHDPQVIASGAFATAPWNQAQPDGLSFNQVTTPVDFSRTAVSLSTPPPAVGAHTDSVLAELGISSDEITRMRQAGVIA